MNWLTITCHLCETEARRNEHLESQTKYDCPICGNYYLTGEASALRAEMVANNQLKKFDPRISGWIRLQNRTGIIPNITKEVIQSLAKRALPGLVERADYLLSEAINKVPERRREFNRGDHKYQAASYSETGEETEFVWNILIHRGHAELMTNCGMTRITIDGYLHEERLRRKPTSPGKAFIAMWFSDDMNDAYDNGLQIGVLDAGYEPVRIDRVEHTNKIDDEIIASIRASAFIVADFTGHRAGVYFEAGFAMGLGMPVVWTCREDEIEDLHFDIRQYNCVPWNEPKDLAEKLKNRIEATIGQGPV